MFLEIEYEKWLTFSVLAALITTFGSLVSLFIKDYFFARSFEIWKQKKSLERIYQNYRDPILLASKELCARFGEILKHYPTVYLRSDVLNLHPEKITKNSIDDPYFKKYKLISTVYRVCAFLGWIELYRQEIVFLDSGREHHNTELEKCLEVIREDFADGQINLAPNWEEWNDRLIFREELRAIGEVMLSEAPDGMGVLGYAKFCEKYASESENEIRKWMPVVQNFLLDLETCCLEFRRIRLARLVVHLVDLVELIDDKKIGSYFAELRKKYENEIRISSR